MVPPTDMVTFLFTDVQGSARLWEQSPESMRTALTRHDALALDHVGAHDGLLIKSRGEGDSLFAVFAAAPDAVRAALTFQQALAVEAWPAEAPLRVRMALHTGEADLREQDYYGVAVNRCARLRSLAQGGQILLSSLTHSLVHEILPEGASLVALGLRELRDLSEKEYVYQLTHPALPAPIPALSGEEMAAPSPSHFLTSLAKRETDLADVTAFLNLPEVTSFLASVQQNVRSSFGRTGVLQALQEANKAGWEGVRKAMAEERLSASAPPPADYDSILESLLHAQPAGETVSRQELLRALTGGGVPRGEARRIVDDFCRRHAPELAGSEGGLLKSLTTLTDRVRRRETPKP